MHNTHLSNQIHIIWGITGQVTTINGKGGGDETKAFLLNMF